MTRVGSWNLQIVYRPAASDGFAGAFADSIIYGHRDLGEQDRAAISWKNLLASVSFSATGASGQLGFPHGRPFVRPSRSRMQARSSARQL